MYMKLLLEYKRRQYQLVHARELAEQAKQMEKERMLQAEKDKLALAAKKAEEQAAKCRKKVFMLSLSFNTRSRKPLCVVRPSGFCCKSGKRQLRLLLTKQRRRRCSSSASSTKSCNSV
jgi:hypothetical protein